MSLIAACFILLPLQEDNEKHLVVNSNDIVWITPYRDDSSQIWANQHGTDLVFGTPQEILQQIKEECDD